MLGNPFTPIQLLTRTAATHSAHKPIPGPRKVHVVRLWTLAYSYWRLLLATMSDFPQVKALELSSDRNLPVWRCGLIALLVAWLYFPIVTQMVYQWYLDPNYSHGFIVPVFSLVVLWKERTRLAALKTEPSSWGLLILLLAVSTLIVGVLGAELFLSRVSLLILIAGVVVFFFGWRCFRTVLFPWAFLILMIPLPAILLTAITLPLQILASSTAATLLPLAGVPVLREGNIINLPAMQLEVAEACSGIRSLLSLITLCIVYGFMAETRTWVRIVLLLSSIPIAVAANSLRIVVTGILAQYWNPARAHGFFHVFSGWLIFLISLGLLIGLHRLLCLQEVKPRVA